MFKADATNNVKSHINGIEWYVPHYTPIMEQQKIPSKLILSETPSRLQFVEKSFFKYEMITRKFWTSELSTQEGVNVCGNSKKR